MKTTKIKVLKIKTLSGQHYEIDMDCVNEAASVIRSNNNDNEQSVILTIDGERIRAQKVSCITRISSDKGEGGDHAS
ncbi:hypothetical protein [Hafnia alvei]|uniref:hypothetical protein n=1 Tax=Hafnia alvei TaxID=569 RepID=UPI00061D35BF|nr:hypothetical protein [Hafnia alvei]KKF38914.1 hypothetical protein PU01_20475 [Hafnia alvei]MBW3474334.1 hypothetical protein [Hafnia alvei]